MKIFRKKVNFFQLLTHQCEIMRRGLDALYKYCMSVGKPDHESYGDMVIAIEDEGDIARRDLVNELNATFITPMERNDIFDLSGQLDEVLDYAKNSIDEMRFFEIEPNEDMTKMVAILCDIAEHIEKAVEVGARYYKALSSLFEGDDFKSIFKYREVYRHLNTTADKAEMAMDILLDILNSL